MLKNTKPYTRWWWFSGPIERESIDVQLDWTASQGFGGVEIAWVYPQHGSAPEEGPQFLDAEFIASVRYAEEACRKRGLGCDLTFGTLWPFNGTFIPKEYSSRTLTGYSHQRIDRSWEIRYADKQAPVLDHLSKEALAWYGDYLLSKGLAEGNSDALFCDSWEVDPELLGYAGMYEDFYQHCQYDLSPFITKMDQYPEVRFDYRKLVSDKILSSFYAPYTEICHTVGKLARVQCHGAPTDLLAAYALSDIPETETLLFDPDFALFAASAAALTDKPVVSSESFTCAYGWVPSNEKPPWIGEERVSDLRCIADAQFANGVNRVVWHGMPFSTPENPAHFYATVHVGPDSSLAPSFFSFNRYLAAVSEYMSLGESVSELAVYLPLEDQWMKDELPEELKKPSSAWYWELQELKPDPMLQPYRPLWFSPSWIERLAYSHGKLLFYGRDIGSLFCDSEWMLFSSVEKLAALMEAGAPIIFNRLPKEPGRDKHELFSEKLKIIEAHNSLTLKDIPPLVISEVPLDFWCRRVGESLYFFFAHPQMRNLRYPMSYGYGDSLQNQTVAVELPGVKSASGTLTFELNFIENNSILCKVDEQEKSVRFIEMPQIID